MRLEAFASTDRIGNRKVIAGCMIDRLPQKGLPVSHGAGGQLEPQQRHLKPGLY
jgi:hypothetical protein